jgi:hypothetical protein
MPTAVQAGMPKKSAKIPCGGVMLVSISMPTVSLFSIAPSKPRAKPCFPITLLP